MTLTKRVELTQQPEINQELDLISKKQASLLSGISCSTIDRLIKRGDLPIKKLGKNKQSKVFLKRAEFLEFFKTQKVQN